MNIEGYAFVAGSMSILVGIPVFIVFVMIGCAGTPPTPDQVNAYSQAAHTAIHSAVQDYKEVKPLLKK